MKAICVARLCELLCETKWVDQAFLNGASGEKELSSSDMGLYDKMCGIWGVGLVSPMDWCMGVCCGGGLAR